MQENERQHMNRQWGELPKSRRFEGMIQAIFTLHYVCILYDALRNRAEWESWEMVLVVVLLGISWMTFVSGPFDFHRRVSIYTLCVFGALLGVSLRAENFSETFLQVCAIVVLLGLGGYVDHIFIATGYVIINLLCHLFITKTIAITEASEWELLLIQHANLLCVMLFVRFWMIMRARSLNQTGEIIQRMTQMEHSKDDFIANVSHEIRTPINTISGMSELLAYEKDEKKRMEKISAIQAAGQSLMGVVDDILDFSELQSGSFELVEDGYDITSTVNDIINMSMAMKGTNNLELIVDLDQNIPRRLLGDERKIRRAIMNLMNNAIKFTKEGGVLLSISSRKEEYGINLLISIKDTGIGMSDAMVEQLFMTYNQADTGRDRQNGGVGLGFAISHALVQAMGGIITIKSQPGHGTTMQITIPQKVVDSRPIVKLNNPEKYRVISYVDMERDSVAGLRDIYRTIMEKMGRQSGVHFHLCSNSAELHRRVDRENYTHLFVAIKDYIKDKDYYNNLANRLHVTVFMDSDDAPEITSTNISQITKPLYVLPIMNVLNGSKDKRYQEVGERIKTYTTEDVHALVVDDNLMNIKVLQGLLGEYGIHVVSALSGYEAIEKLRDAKYDFILMDYMMPEMDGVETLKRIRAKGDRYSVEVPILAVTANAVAGTRNMLLKAGFNEFVEKPVEISSLERILLKYIEPYKVKYTDKAHSVEDLVEQKGEADFLDYLDLDVESGKLYCGGRELYIQILKEYVKKGAFNWEPIQSAYEAQDWDNYVICVHAIKSSMKSIGAERVFELARELELQGKAKNYTYIVEHHGQMLAQYKGVIQTLVACPQLATAVQTQSQEEAGAITREAISEALFDQALHTFESFGYALDQEGMLKVLSDLEQYSYRGTNLKEALSSIRYKVEMADYMSAVEALLQIKSRLQ